ncbi:hypothetical protein C1H46_032736 [Malus baccata]|uniref:Uncharacterized protein n=1 Tax=Malus baccata TaxID=106549 RepID=A0A540L5U8_MALBA|nr:hypothetical protein C1H46_032736 [Malus baccata]
MDDQQPPSTNPPNPANPAEPPNPAPLEMTITALRDLFHPQQFDKRQIIYTLADGVTYLHSETIKDTIASHNRFYRRNDVLVNPVPPGGPPVPGAITLPPPEPQQQHFGSHGCSYH